ncbi:MAG: response regulator [Deltaproteobacteria bacterium]|nr:response regulator [Deltaproteobacteria bacterium]
MAKKILIIDDEEMLRSLLKTRLENAGYKTQSATDGKAGLELARKEIPNLIILDIMMPVLDGYQFCLITQNDERLRKIPIIMLTGMNEPVDKITGKAFGAVEYITKPFDSVKLVESVNRLLAV